MRRETTVTPDKPRSAWDFALMMLTVVALGGLGVQSFLGTAYAWWGERTQPGWDAIGYPAFVEAMNAVAAPLVIGLVILLGLCVPKRVLARRALVAASAGLAGVGIAAWIITGSPTHGITVFLLVASALQVIVLVMTFADAPRLSYLTEGRLVRIGSSALHLGFLVFALVVVALQDSPWMLPVFWLASALLVAGSALSFYAGPLARRRTLARSP